jgi:hypothetical protein
VDVPTQPAVESTVEYSGLAPAALNRQHFRVEQTERIPRSLVEAATVAAQTRAARRC